jgi:hypothetical protein
MAERSLAAKMIANDFIGNWKETPVRTFGAFDSWLFAYTPYPLVAARRSITAAASLAIFESPRINVFSPAEKRSEQGNFFFGS